MCAHSHLCCCHHHRRLYESNIAERGHGYAHSRSVRLIHRKQAAVGTGTQWRLWGGARPATHRTCCCCWLIRQAQNMQQSHHCDCVAESMNRPIATWNRIRSQRSAFSGGLLHSMPAIIAVYLILTIHHHHPTTPQPHTTTQPHNHITTQPHNHTTTQTTTQPTTQTTKHQARPSRLTKGLCVKSSPHRGGTTRSTRSLGKTTIPGI